MRATELVLLVLAVEGVALGAALVVIFGYAVWSKRTRSLRARRLTAARAIIATHVESQRVPREQMLMLASLSRDDQLRLFVELAPSIGDAERGWLRAVATELGLLEDSIRQTRSPRWWTRLVGARLLTIVNADPKTMHPMLADEEPMVRAQVAGYVAQHPTLEGIDALIGMLAAPDAIVRFAAKDGLMRLGAAASPTLVSRLRDPADPQIIPLLEVACVTATHAYMAAATLHHRDERPEVRLLVARLLRGIGGPAAGEHLTRMASDTAPKVREAAIEALGHLNHWIASPVIAKLLDDPVARVRLSAALALDQLGPTGELLLRRAKGKGSERAATAASRILDDPSRRAATG